MRKITYLSEINEYGYVGYQFEDSKRFASAKVKEDSKGKYFVSKKVKYYLDDFQKKECMICGNANTNEIESATLYSDGDGNEGVFEEYMCKEGKGCC